MILEVHNKTGMKRSLDMKQVISEAFASSFAVVTAWDHSKLVGCGRMISDGKMYSGIFDVVVIGRTIMKMLVEKAPETCIYLTSTFDHEKFYSKLGFKKHKTAMALYPGKMAESCYLEQK